MFSAFLSHEYSTVALACLLLAESTACEFSGWRGSHNDVWELAGQFNAGSLGEPRAAAWAPPAADGTAAALDARAAAVASVAKLPLSLLAPGLDACLTTLERCCALLQERRDQP